MINFVISIVMSLDFLGMIRVQPEETGKIPNLQIAVISDAHINTSKPLNTKKLEKALNDIHQIAPYYNAIAVGGDMTDHGLLKEYDLFNSILHSNMNQQTNVFMVIGNHEWQERKLIRRSKVTDAQLAERFKEKMNVPGIYYDKWLNGYHFITIAGEKSETTMVAAYHNEADADSAYISDNQFQWLEKTLAINADNGKPIFVFLHQPITNTVYGSEFGAGLEDQKLLGILRKYPQVIFFSGHSHYPLNYPNNIDEDGITMVNTSAVAYTYTRGTGVNYSQSQGYIVNIFDDRVELKAREFSTGTWIRTTIIPVHKETQPLSQAGFLIQTSTASTNLNKNRYINWYASPIEFSS